MQRKISCVPKWLVPKEFSHGESDFRIRFKAICIWRKSAFDLASFRFSLFVNPIHDLYSISTTHLQHMAVYSHPPPPSSNRFFTVNWWPSEQIRKLSALASFFRSLPQRLQYLFHRSFYLQFFCGLVWVVGALSYPAPNYSNWILTRAVW